MPNSTRNLHPNTIAFSQLEPEVALLILDIIDAIVSVLRWRQPSRLLLTAILTRLGTMEILELSHVDFGAALWPYLKDSARDQKYFKWLQKFKEDMVLSNFYPVEVKKPKPGHYVNGNFKSHPTQYLTGIFWNLFRAVQDDALKCDLFSIEEDKRRLKVRSIVREWLKKCGAVKIERQKIEKEKEQKPASLPCKCDCSSCAQCAAKSATASEAERARLAQVRVTKESVEARLHSHVEALFECGQDWMNLGLGFDRFNLKLQNDYDDLLTRLVGAVKRVNAPSLKLVGGQAK